MHEWHLKLFCIHFVFFFLFFLLTLKKDFFSCLFSFFRNIYHILHSVAASAIQKRCLCACVCAWCVWVKHLCSMEGQGIEKEREKGAASPVPGDTAAVVTCRLWPDVTQAIRPITFQVPDKRFLWALYQTEAWDEFKAKQSHAPRGTVRPRKNSGHRWVSSNQKVLKMNIEIYTWVLEWTGGKSVFCVTWCWMLSRMSTATVQPLSLEIRWHLMGKWAELSEIWLY